MKITNALPPIPKPTPSATPPNPKKNVDSPTEKSSPGSVLISESLARMQLSQHGITDPTSEQLETALRGGPISGEAEENTPSAEVPGILTLRNQKMGWGRIAKELGIKLGAAVSALRAQAQTPATTEPPEVTTEVVNPEVEPVVSQPDLSEPVAENLFDPFDPEKSDESPGPSENNPLQES